MISVDSPRREQIRPASPSKFGMAPASSSPRGASIARGVSPWRGLIHPRGINPSGRTMSPLRVRSSLSNLVLNFAVDAKKEKIRENGVADDAHLLRLLHNRLLQWRFANARANAVVSAQKMRAEVNLHSVKDAICSAVDVMQAMAYSISLLLPKVGKISCLAEELNRVNVKEQGMLDVCRDILNTISALQVTECGLRAQAIQLQC